ncbi:AraC family transcriptional regulator [Paraburkholderia sp. J12]|uniref:helix-turn-helix transcriptional regulator n=1 Tax=Paraburkholderia sp. J12 TaxID=2805432 RepID=UPI002ABDD6EF|nr:AraC family transcriptional regulator [Paraburkholderia sp. J12]
MDDKHATSDRAIYVRQGVGVTAGILQKSELRFSRLVVDQPTLIVLHRGFKTLQSGDRVWQLEGGQAIALAGGQTVTIGNRPSRDGAYEAQWLTWDPAILANYNKGPLKDPLVDATILTHIDDELYAAFLRAREAIRLNDVIPQEVAQHRVAEVLLWLSSFGIRFRTQTTMSLSTRVRKLVESSPGEKWSIASVADRLALSEATLRRHLAVEGETLGNVLVDTRMSLALRLLQSTDAPVSNIAFDVGYESSSRFAIRFRQRFGFSPTAVRGHRGREGLIANTVIALNDMASSEYSHVSDDDTALT